MAGWALAQNRLDFAASLLLCFAVFLRTGEILQLRAFNVLLLGECSLVVLLPLTKVGPRRGAPERVPVDDGWCAGFGAVWMRFFVSLHVPCKLWECRQMFSDLTPSDAAGQRMSCSWVGGVVRQQPLSTLKKVWFELVNFNSP
eukprot:599729-Amphidinium_carterae.3